jgi:hypothetical protein
MIAFGDPIGQTFDFRDGAPRMPDSCATGLCAGPYPTCCWSRPDIWDGNFRRGFVT